MSAGVASFSPALAECGEDGALQALRLRVRSAVLDRPGVYRMFSPAGEVLYVGKSKQLRTRLLSYFRASFPEEKGARLIREVQSIEWDYAPSEFASLLLELRQIKKYRPRYNVAMKRDARHYAFIKLYSGVAPRLQVVRGGTYQAGATYYGPFVGAAAMEEAVRELNDVLGLRDCSLDKRMHFADQVDLFALPLRTPGCVRYEIGKCLGPCVGAVTAGRYGGAVERARHFLEGGDSSPMDALRVEMQRCSDAMEYERAAYLRDKLSRLERLAEQFGRLRFAVESLSFLYAVPGVGGDDRVYVIGRGQVRGEFPMPSSRVEGKTLLKAASDLLSGVTGGVTGPIPTHEIDELLLLSHWFRANPVELERTLAPEGFPERAVARTLRELIAAV